MSHGINLNATPRARCNADFETVPPMALRAWGTAVRRVGDHIAARIRFAIAFAAHGRMPVTMSHEVWGMASVQAGGEARRAVVCRVARLRLCEPWACMVCGTFGGAVQQARRTPDTRRVRRPHD